MIREVFSHSDSLIDRLDPRIKVLSAGLYSFTIALCDDILALVVGLVIALALITTARVDLRELIPRIAAINVLILLLWLFVPITFKGAPVFHIGPLSITREGVIFSILITLRSNAIMLAFIALVATMPIAKVGHALSRLFVPPKIIGLLMMTYRYVFVLEQEYQKLIRAAKVRGFKPGTNIHTYRTYSYLIGMLFVRASARAERVHQAMLCRGFNGKFYSLEEFTLSKRDLLWSALMLSSLLVIGVLEWTKTG